MAQYINKDALETEINRQHKILMQTNHTYGAQFVLGFRQACRQIIDFLDTLEVKEVDLDKKIGDWYNINGIPVTSDALKETARHFFELGLKAKQKGE